jgi:autotransporter family porin
VPGHLGTLPPGAALPSSAQCAAQVRAAPPATELRPGNAAPNTTSGRVLPGAKGLLGRVDGAFTGTTEEILRWAACKWGVDEDLVKAQAAVESWWRMDTKGDWGTDPSRCAPGHNLGTDGTPGSCPESFGLLQVRYPFHKIAFSEAITSSALNVDYAYARWRECYVGEYTWLNSEERGSTYAAGDVWGCVGTWFAGRWHTAAADDYIAKVQDYLEQRIWTSAEFAEP